MMTLAEVKFLVICEWIVNKVDASCERDRYELFWYSQLSVNELDMSCERNGLNLSGQ
jgi:hypothetical protein